jgi:hypothetical protein
MKCFICNKETDAWLLLKNDNIRTDCEGKNIGDTIQLCSFSCTNKCSKYLPNNYSRLVLNKEDFCYLRPTTTIPKTEFSYLTFNEIQGLTDIDKEVYYKEKDSKLELDPLISELHKELEIEDENTFYLENGESSSDNEICDDY